MSSIVPAVAAPARAPRQCPSSAPAIAGNRAAQADPRWPAIAAALAALRESGRYAVRIVDADCACGTLLITAARYARLLGFAAIEGRGIDGSPALIGRARAAAARLRDPAIGFAFECADVKAALISEADFPADVVLWHGEPGVGCRGDLAQALTAAGKLVIADGMASLGRRAA